MGDLIIQETGNVFFSNGGSLLVKIQSVLGVLDDGVWALWLIFPMALWLYVIYLKKNNELVSNG